MTRAKKTAGRPAGGLPEGPPESTEYMTKAKALAYIRDLGIPVGEHFFQGQRSRRKGPPLHYFGPRGLFRRDEFEAWFLAFFRAETWDRKPNAEAAVRAKKVKDRARAKAKAAEVTGAGEQRAE